MPPSHFPSLFPGVKQKCSEWAAGASRDTSGLGCGDGSLGIQGSGGLGFRVSGSPGVWGSVSLGLWVSGVWGPGALIEALSSRRDLRPAFLSGQVPRVVL